MRISPQVGVPLVVVLFALALGLSVCLKPREAKPGRLPVKRTESGEKLRLIYFRCRECGETWLVYELDPAKVNVRGGGLTGQACAIQLGVARALLVEDEDRRSALRREGLLTRDPRRVERKKYGQPKARKRFQFSKR